MPIYASVNWVIIGSGNGLSPAPHQAITWTNAGLLAIGRLETNFTEVSFIQENAPEYVICQNGDHFAQGVS